jgi:hypothetical protein
MAVDPIRQLAEVIKIIFDASVALGTRGNELLAMLLDELPDTEPPTPLTATVGEDTSDTTRMTALLTWDNAGTGNHVTIDWGAPDAVDDDEPATGTKSYQYPSAGDYTVAVTDLDDAARTVSVAVTVPFTVTGAP